MIEEVSIRNIGGVASATLRFEKGFTVITGESGAGKSSLVRSLELLGGKRSQTAFLRAGEEEGSVEAVLSGIGGERRLNWPTPKRAALSSQKESSQETGGAEPTSRTGPRPCPFLRR